MTAPVWRVPGRLPNVSESLKPLLDLQQVDLAHDRLVERRERLPERAKVAELKGRVREVEDAIAGRENDIAAVVRKIDGFESELSTLEEKIVREETKLYSGQVVNPKEIMALQAEIEMLKRRKGPLEEQILEIMVSRDELFGDRDRMRAEVNDLEKEASVLRDAIDASTREIDAELEGEAAKRAGIAPRIPAEVLELYASLREQKKGIGVGALEQGICSACREALSAMEVDRIRQAARAGETMFRCEHCRRILVLT